MPASGGPPGPTDDHDENGAFVIVIGIDAHKQSHTLVAIDQTGIKRGEKTISATSTGHREAFQWVRTTFGNDVVWGIEDQRSLTALLERELLAENQKVIRVPPQYMARSRGSARAWGKSDPIDALAAARAVLREPNLPVAVHDRVSWELKLLVDRREDLVAQRVDAVNRLGLKLHQISPASPQPKKLHFGVRRRLLDEYLAHQPGLLAELARQEVADIDYFSHTIDDLTKRIALIVNKLGSTLPLLPGCAELTAAKLIAETANMDRFHSEAAFARYAGIAPIPMWSGSTEGRVRLSRSGNRQCNTAIHRIALVQIRLDGPGREYFLRRRAEGTPGKAAVRCLKRRICRVVYTRLLADYEQRQQPRPAASATPESSTPAWMQTAILASALQEQADQDRGALDRIVDESVVVDPDDDLDLG